MRPLLTGAKLLEFEAILLLMIFFYPKKLVKMKKKFLSITFLFVSLSVFSQTQQILSMNGLLVCMTLKGNPGAFLVIEQIEEMGYYKCEETGVNMWLHMCRIDNNNQLVCNLELFAQPDQSSQVHRVIYTSSSKFYDGQAWRDGLSHLGFRKTEDNSKNDLFNVFNETWEGTFEGFYVKATIKENLNKGEIELSRYK